MPAMIWCTGCGRYAGCISAPSAQALSDFGASRGGLFQAVASMLVGSLNDCETGGRFPTELIPFLCAECYPPLDKTLLEVTKHEQEKQQGYDKESKRKESADQAEQGGANVE